MNGRWRSRWGVRQVSGREAKTRHRGTLCFASRGLRHRFGKLPARRRHTHLVAGQRPGRVRHHARGCVRDGGAYIPVTRRSHSCHIGGRDRCSWRDPKPDARVPTFSRGPRVWTAHRRPHGTYETTRVAHESLLVFTFSTYCSYICTVELCLKFVSSLADSIWVCELCVLF